MSASPHSSTATADSGLVAHLRDVAIRAAHAVGDELLAAFRTPMETDVKADFHDIVTIHDKRTEQFLKNFISCEIADSRFVGEEGGAEGKGRISWYIDPIDGTANFASGLAFWCVSIGAVIGGEIVAGVVFDPVTGNTFSADIGGAWLNGAPLRSRARPSEAEAVLITGYPVARDLKLDGRQKALDNFALLAERFSTVRRPGSAALSLCHVAAGWADAAMGFGVNAWDVTAAILILRQAGGSYTPYGLGKVPVHAADFLCPGYVAIGEGGHYPTLDRIASAVSAQRETGFPDPLPSRTGTAGAPAVSALPAHSRARPVPSEHELDIREGALLDLIREAGVLAQAAFEADGGGFEMKGPQDFLTVTDSAVEKLLRARLAALFPGDGFVGEESGAAPGDILWVVDPIDGTANFARRIPHYCISVALATQDEILLGAIYDPAHDELYHARAGRGARRNGVPISVSTVTDPRSACVELGWSVRVPNAEYLAVMSRILDAGANIRRSASGALGLAYVADGRSDAYAELHMHAWDCLAGLLLVREAGGKVCDFMSSGGLRSGGSVLAAAPGVAALMTGASGIACQ